MDDLKRYILEEYNFDCKVNFLFQKYGFDTIIKTAISLLDNRNVDVYHTVITFIRDCYIGSDLSTHDSGKYITLLKKHNTFDLIGSFLYSPIQGIRLSTIFTFGKFSLKYNIDKLVSAFKQYYMYHDCICAFDTIQELCWLKYNKSKDLIQILLHSDFIMNNLYAFLFFRDDDVLLKKNINTIEETKKNRIFNFLNINGSINELVIELEKIDFCNVFYSNFMYRNNMEIFDNNEFEIVIKYYLDNYQKIHDQFAKIGNRNDFDKIYQTVYRELFL